MKIAILGFSSEGRSSYQHFTAKDGGQHSVTILDVSETISVPTGADSVLGEAYLQNLDRFDLIVRTAGLAPHLIFEANPDLNPAKVTTQINEFFTVSPTRQIIGVTGTKGKGTTSTLIHLMLQAAGKRAQLAGNIGLPALEILPELQADDWVVLELSSFQLIDLQSSPHIAVCLMVVPEHLNWHADMAEYIAAKSQLFVHQAAEDTAIYYGANENSVAVSGAGAAHKIPYFQPPGAHVENGALIIDGQAICQTSELQLLGEHNWQNACAAVTAVWQVTQDTAAMRSVLARFSGLPHRLELVREVAGVKYYDDSFGTTPETAIVAIKAFTSPKVIILGGSDKGAQYDKLAACVAANNVRQVIVIGTTGPTMQLSLAAAGFTDVQAGDTSLSKIVAQAQAAAQQGDIVLLSTGCASFDMFKDYRDRGEQFKQAVQALA